MLIDQQVIMREIVHLVLLRLVILIATVVALIFVAGCKERALPPPLVEGRCTVAEYTGSTPSKARCQWSGVTWECDDAVNGHGKRCVVITPPTTVTVEAAPSDGPVTR